MTGGSLERKADGKYVAKPQTPGTEAVITVSAQNEGHAQEMGKFILCI